MPDPSDHARRIELLERTLREIVALAEKHPASPGLRDARTLALAALNAPPPQERR